MTQKNVIIIGILAALLYILVVPSLGVLQSPSRPDGLGDVLNTLTSFLTANDASAVSPRGTVHTIDGRVVMLDGPLTPAQNVWGIIICAGLIVLVWKAAGK